MTVPTFSWRHVAAPGGVLQLLPQSTVGGVKFRILDLADQLDLGLIQWSSFEAPRVSQDGLAYFGGVFSAGRDMVVPIWCECGSLAKALDTQLDLQRWFHNHAMGFLRISRTNSASEVFTVEAKCYVKERQGFIQSHSQGGAGIVGDAEIGNLLYVVRLCAPYPHFRRGREAIVAVASGQFPANPTVVIENNCPNEIGVYVGLAKAGGTIVSTTVKNESTGRYITVTDPMVEPIVIDWLKTSPDTPAVRQGTTSLLGKVNVGAKLTLIPGSNLLRFSGAGSGPTYNWEVLITESYDSI